MIENVYIIMNKPAGYVCSAASDSHKTVYELLTPQLQSLLKAKRGHRLHTVGRLDCETTGLLLITNDGDFSNRLTRPENKIQKKYIAQLKNPVLEKEQSEYVKAFFEGVTLPAEKKAPEQKSGGAQLHFLAPDKACVTVTEGKFHEVRRLFRAVGNEVISLKRISMENYSLENEELLPGQWKQINIL